jgi:hypothetical protein
MTDVEVRRRGTGISKLVGLIVVLWLVIGAFAAYQRDYFKGKDETCAHFSTIVVTIVAGPLNYVGANPKVKNCNLPQPSK